MNILLLMSALTLLVMLCAFVVLTQEDREILREQDSLPLGQLSAGD